MNGPMPSVIHKLIKIISDKVSDCETLDELDRIVLDHRQWKKCHELFSRIRTKTNLATEPKQIAQYRFEEICAKSIYNISHEKAPFDADSPFWIIPHAFLLARELGIDQLEVITIVMEQ